MPGTLAGGKKAAKTNKLRQGEDFYKRIGAIGGRNGHTGGFAESYERAMWAGAIGGKRSIRGWKLINKKRTLRSLILYYRNRADAGLLMRVNERTGERKIYRDDVVYAD